MPAVITPPYQQYTNVVNNLSLASGSVSAPIPYDIFDIDEIRLIGQLALIGASLSTAFVYFRDTVSSGGVNAKDTLCFGARSTSNVAYISTSYMMQVQATRNVALSDWQRLRFDFTIKRDKYAADMLLLEGDVWQFGNSSSTYFLNTKVRGLCFISNPNTNGFEFLVDAGNTLGAGSSVNVYRNNHPIES